MADNMGKVSRYYGPPTDPSLDAHRDNDHLTRWEADCTCRACRRARRGLAPRDSMFGEWEFWCFVAAVVIFAMVVR